MNFEKRKKILQYSYKLKWRQQERLPRNGAKSIAPTLSTHAAMTSRGSRALVRRMWIRFY